MNKKNLMDRSYAATLIISSVIIIIVQISSLAITTVLRVNDVNRKAVLTADEITVFLSEPMYDLDDEQVLKIAEFLLSSGRVSGIRIDSSATGIIIDNWDPGESFWVKPQYRAVDYRNAHIGDISIQYNDSEFIEFNRTALITTLALLAGVLSANFLGLNIIIRKRIQSTFSILVDGIKKIEYSGDNYTIPHSGYTDFDQIIDSMNEMSGRLREKQRELLYANNMLEQRVAERTKALEDSLNELKSMQDRLVEASKLSVLGQLSAGIAHEFNTPLGAIISTAGSLVDFFDHSLDDQYDFQQTLTDDEKKLFKKFYSLGMTRSRNLNMNFISRKRQQEIKKKLEGKGMGQEASGIIVEILTDAGITESFDELLPYLSVERSVEVVSEASKPVAARRMIEVISESGRKAADVISAFRSYLSSDSDETDRVVDVDADLKKVLILLQNDLKTGITVKTSFAGVHVMGHSDRLSQVWMNLIRNAAQAMDYNGELIIETESCDNTACIRVIDSGPGIPEGIIENIFEPFFTTRQKGEGMGLGLDICIRIIEKYKGSIEVSSRPGRTEFTVILPLKVVG